jgi:hypothetical protein
MAALVMAQQPAKTASQQHHASATKIFRGTVDSVSLADPTKGTKSEVTVIDKLNKSMVFLVKSTTTLYGASGSAITLDKIIKGNPVSIKYTTTAEGVHEAASIRLLK